MLRRATIFTCACAFALLLTALFIQPDTVSANNGCDYRHQHTPIYEGRSWWGWGNDIEYRHTRNFTSLCGYIEIARNGNTCFHARIRYYPWGSWHTFTSDWKWVCSSTVRMNSERVLTGTNFRVETKGSTFHPLVLTD